MTARRFRRLALPVVVAAVALGAAGCSNNTLNDAASVSYQGTDGQTHHVHISDSTLQSDVQQYLDNKQYVKAFLTSTRGNNTDTADPRFVAFVLGNLIRTAVVDSVFNEKHLTVTPADLDAAKQSVIASTDPNSASGSGASPNPAVFNAFPKAVQDRLVQTEARLHAVENALATTPTDAQARDFYTKNLAQICPSGKYISVIGAPDTATAQGVVDKLKGGASVAAAAGTLQTRSGCPDASQLPSVIASAVNAAKPGEPVGPIAFQGQNYVLVVRPPTFEDFRNDIMQQLQQQGSQQSLKPLTDRLKALQVHVNPRYGTWGLTSNGNYAVTPPAAPQPRNQREASAADTSTTVPLGG